MSNAIKIFHKSELVKSESDLHLIHCIHGVKKGDTYEFYGQRAVVGRAQNADLKTYDLKTSREHVEIKKIGQELVLTDLKSQNGLYVNELKVKQHTLSHGDKFIVGQTVYEYEYRTAEKDDRSSINADEEQKKPPIIFIVAAIIVFIVSVLDFDDNETNKDSKKEQKEYKDPFADSLIKRNKENKKVNEKLNVYFQRGLREYREKNYYRAMTEFKSAKSWSPDDPLTAFYIRKTKDELDKTVKNEFNSATRAEQSLKFNVAVVHYCSIVRVLKNFSNSDDKAKIEKAKKKIEDIEDRLSLQRGDLACDNLSKSI